jgi:hypothetical protein
VLLEDVKKIVTARIAQRRGRGAAPQSVACECHERNDPAAKFRLCGDARRLLALALQ